jgi:ribonuclease VapC
MIVFDASAILAFLFDEPGAARVEAALAESCLSTVNFAEILSKCVDRGAALDPTRHALESSPIELVPFDVGQATRVAALRQHVPHSLSFGDRACLALAQLRRTTVITADRAWARVQLDGVRVELLR